jgi:hypothetical protein
LILGNKASIDFYAINMLMLNKLRKLSIFDKSAAIIILLFGLIIISKPFFLTYVAEDITYHSLVAENFIRAGGVTTWDFWESLPEGRPQNYPPIFHLLLVPFFYFGAETQVIQLVFPLFCFLIILLSWLGLRKIFTDQVAFFGLILSLADTQYLVFQTTIVPASIVLALSPLSISFIKERRWLAISAVLAIMFYTHMIMPWIIVSAIIIWLAADRDRLKKFIWSLILAILLYSPWLIHLIYNHQFIKYIDSSYQTADEPINNLAFNLSFWLLVSLSTIYLTFKNKVKPAEKISFFIILMIVQIPLIFYLFPDRFFSSGGFFAGATILAYTISLFWNKYHGYWHKLAIISLCTLLSVTYQIFIINKVTNTSTVVLSPSFWSQAVLIKNLDEYKVIKPNYRFSEENINLAKLINKNTVLGDTILNVSPILDISLARETQKYAIAQFFAALSNRASLNRRLPDYHKLDNVDPAKATIILADIHQTYLSTLPIKKKDEIIATTIKNDFIYLGESGRLIAFKNKSADTIKSKPAKPVVSFFTAYLLLALLIALIILDKRKSIAPEE